MTMTAAPFSSASLQGRDRGDDALVGGHAAVLDRHVEVLADQHALTGDVEIGKAKHGHRQLRNRRGSAHYNGTPAALQRLALAALRHANLTRIKTSGNGTA